MRSVLMSSLMLSLLILCGPSTTYAGGRGSGTSIGGNRSSSRSHGTSRTKGSSTALPYSVPYAVPGAYYPTPVYVPVQVNSRPSNLSPRFMAVLQNGTKHSLGIPNGRNDDSLFTEAHRLADKHGQAVTITQGNRIVATITPHNTTSDVFVHGYTQYPK